MRSQNRGIGRVFIVVPQTKIVQKGDPEALSPAERDVFVYAQRNNALLYQTSRTPK